ncbi:hypothetical protein V8C44DRAFT_65424 [Trichoderma aethiopicum]
MTRSFIHLPQPNEIASPPLPLRLSTLPYDIRSPRTTSPHVQEIHNRKERIRCWEQQKIWYMSAAPNHNSHKSSSPPNHGNETTISASSSPIIAHLHNPSLHIPILEPPLTRRHLSPRPATESRTPRINDNVHSDIRRTSENPTRRKSPPITSFLITKPPHLPSPSSTQSVLGSCHYKSDPPHAKRASGRCTEKGKA